MTNKELTGQDLYITNQIIVLAPKQIAFNVREIALNILPNKLVTDLSETEKSIFSTYTSESYYDNIEAYLRDKKFIVPDADKWKLSETGEKAKDLGGIAKYNNFINKENKKKSFQDFPKTYWFFITLITYLLGLSTPTIQEFLKKRILLKSTQPVQKSRQIKDTSVISNSK